MLHKGGKMKSFRKCKHKYVKFRLHDNKGNSWPVRECSICKHQQVLGADGWIDDSWRIWGKNLIKKEIL